MNRTAESLERDGRRRQRLGDFLYKQVLSQIMSGKYDVGARLPTEADLATRFDVSRPVVREALARLREDGVIISRQGSGSYVSRRPAGAVLEFTQVDSIADIQRCFEFRFDIEGGAAALAAQRWTDDTLEELHKALARLDIVTEDRGLGIDADFSFHVAVAQATGNRFFASTLASLQSHITFGMNLTRNLSLLRANERLAAVQAEHHEIVEAIRTRNPDWAREAMQAHLANARRRIFEGTDQNI